MMKSYEDRVRALIIDAEARVRISRVLDYAEEHHYHPDTDPIPGDNEEFVCTLRTFRCVFTYTVMRGRVWRHLSISIPSKNYPHPLAVFTIATEFGFTGWDGNTCDRIPEGWAARVDKNEHCVTVIQERKE